MSNKNNEYEYFNSSISVSSLNTNLLLSEFSVLRCPSCKLIPLIKLNSFEDTLEYLCPNNHKEKGKFEDIYKKLKLNNLNNLICSFCSNKSVFYCPNCVNFVCNEHKKVEENKKHVLININNIDCYCFKHNHKISDYCKTEKLFICAECDHSIKKNCNLIHLKNLIFKEEKINNYIKLMNENRNLKFFNDLEKILNDFIKKIQQIKTNLNKINYRSLFLDLINSYKFKINNNCYNYNNYNNIILNLENFDDGKSKFLNIFNDLKTKLKDFENKFITTPEKSTKQSEPNEISLNSLKIFKQINYNEVIYSIKKLNDNRIAFGGKSSILLILNKNFEFDLNVNFNSNTIRFINQLKNLNLILSFENNSIKIIKIENKNYSIVQDIQNAHNNLINFIIELSNKNFVTSCFDGSVKFWGLNANNQYIKRFKVMEQKYVYNVLETKKNEIVYEIGESTIKFFNYNTKQKIKDFNNLTLSGLYLGIRIILIKNFVLVGGNKKIYFFDVNSYNLIKETNYIGVINSLINFNDNSIIIGEETGNVSLFNLNNNKNNVLNNAHKGRVRAILYYNNYLITGGEDFILKIWK